jgi:hypothetical protein
MTDFKLEKLVAKNGIVINPDKSLIDSINQKLYEEVEKLFYGKIIDAMGKGLSMDTYQAAKEFIPICYFSLNEQLPKEQFVIYSKLWEYKNVVSIHPDNLEYLQKVTEGIGVKLEEVKI